MSRIKQVVQRKYNNPKIDKMVEEAEDCSQFYEYGKQDATKANEVTEGYYRENIIATTEANEQTLLAKLQEELSPMTNQRAKQREEKVAEDHYEEHTQAIAESVLKEKALEVKVNSSKVDLFPYYQWIGVIIVGCLFGIGDGIMAFKSFITNGMGFFSSSIIGVMIAISIAGGSHYLAEQVMATTPKVKAILWFIAGLALAALLFIFLSDLRVISLIQSIIPDTSGKVMVSQPDGISRYTIAIISWIIFVVSTLLSMRVWLNKDEFNAARNCIRARKELNQQKQETIALYNCRNESAIEAQERFYTADQINEYTLSIRNRILAIKNKQLTSYTRGYLNNRRDGKLPPFMQNLMLLLLFLAFGACKTTRNVYPSVLVTVAYDITDPHKSKPQIQRIWSLYDFKANPGQSAGFRLRSLTNVFTNDIKKSNIGNESETEEDNTNDLPDYRNKVINAFYDSIALYVSKANDVADTSGVLDNSEVYRPLMYELELLSSSRANRAYMCLYSDLQEFSSETFNSYADTNKTSKEIAAILLKAYPPPRDLRNVVLLFLYKPTTVIQDKAFMKMVEAYKVLLAGTGVKIIIETN